MYVLKVTQSRWTLHSSLPGLFCATPHALKGPPILASSLAISAGLSTVCCTISNTYGVYGLPIPYTMCVETRTVETLTSCTKCWYERRIPECVTQIRVRVRPLYRLLVISRKVDLNFLPEMLGPTLGKAASVMSRRICPGTISSFFSLRSDIMKSHNTI